MAGLTACARIAEALGGRVNRIPPDIGRRLVPLAAGLCAVVLVYAGAGTGAEIPDFTPEQMGGTLQRWMSAEPQNLNPLTGKDLYERYVNDYVYESLLTRDTDTLELEGQLAESWEVSPDGRTITFRLKPEARFSDGHPLTADDVVFTYETVTNPAIDCRSLASYFEDCERCEKIDERTVRFTWRRKYFKSVEVSGGFNPILPKHVYEKHVRIDPEKADEAGIRHFNDLVQGFVGSGPYKFEDWTTGHEISLTRNEEYWGKPRAYDRIVFRLITEEQPSVQAFLSGDIDLLSVTPKWWVKLKEIKEEDPERGRTFEMYRYITPSNGYQYVGWNNRKYRTEAGPDGEKRTVSEPHPLFGDWRVRRAMTHLIARDVLLEHVFEGIGRVATGPFFPLGNQAAPDVEPWSHDRREALRLLAEAGWKDRDRDGWLENEAGERFEFEWSIPAGNQTYRDTCRIMKEELRRVGIDATVRYYTWSVFVTLLDTRQFDAVRLAWGGGGVESDPYQIWHSDQIADQGHNFISFSNPTADRLIIQARSELDTHKRNRLYHRFHRLLHDLQPYTFMRQRESLAVVSTRLKGVTPHRLGLDTEEWWIDPDRRRTGE